MLDVRKCQPGGNQCRGVDQLPGLCGEMQSHGARTGEEERNLKLKLEKSLSSSLPPSPLPPSLPACSPLLVMNPRRPQARFDGLEDLPTPSLLRFSGAGKAHTTLPSPAIIYGIFICRICM